MDAVGGAVPAREGVGRSRSGRRLAALRRALRLQASRLDDPHRIAALVIFILVGGVMLTGLFARGEAAGADARAYWAGVRIWLNGGDPYATNGAFLPYVYPPWMLPFFAPWALLPWDVAWFVWRGAMVALLVWSLDWSYRRRHLETAVAFALLAFPIAANLDTGNITLLLAFMLWGAQFAGPRRAGLLWAIATWMKWVPAPLLLVIVPRARLWGLGWLALCAALSLATLPLTIAQLQALFGFGPRPIRLDYLVLLWAAIPWWWAHPRPLWWLLPTAWPGLVRPWARRGAAALEAASADPRGAGHAGLAAGVRFVRDFLGIEGTLSRPVDSSGTNT